MKGDEPEKPAKIKENRLRNKTGREFYKQGHKQQGVIDYSITPGF
jgi:hypothetical protein